MVKRREISQLDSCWNRAKLSEHIFVLIGRDPAMPNTIRHWCYTRVKLGKNNANDRQIREAMKLANTLDRINQRKLDKVLKEHQ